jgi:dipeptidyl aminopeptidase/acylaminoacyl peptidase
MISVATEPRERGLDMERTMTPGEVGASGTGRALALAGLGLAGLVLGGFPYWAARRVMYPAFEEAMPAGTHIPLDIELSSDAVPEYVVFGGHDGLERSGWFVPGPDARKKPWACVLLLYGYGGYKEQMAYYAKMLHEAGFACFMFDMQGSGMLRGLPVTMGFKERWDTLDAVEYLATREDVDSGRIGALGVSMGAATALMAAEVEPRIRAVVSDSSYADLNDMVQPGLRAFVGPPATFFAPLILRWAEQMVGMKAGEVHPEASAARMGDRPVFVIHGADDQLTDARSAPRIYAAASGPKELWVVPDCGHARAPEVAHDEYVRRVSAFFRDALAEETMARAG